MALKFLKTILILAILIFPSCNQNTEEDVIFSEKSYSENSVITRSSIDFENDATFIRLKHITDSIVGNEHSNISTYSIKENLDLAMTAAADAKGFIDGVKFGWKLGKNISGKIATATVFGVIFSVAYSSLAVLQIGIIDSFGNAKNYNYVVSATASVYQENNIYSMMLQTVNDFNIRVNPQNFSLVHNSYAHNPILSRIKNQTILSNSDLLQTFSQDQLTVFNTQNFINRYNTINQRLKNDYELLHDAFFPRESNIYYRYISAIKLIRTENFDECLKKIEGLCYEYSNVIKSDRFLSEEHKNDLIQSLYVAPFSLIYWHQKISKI